MRYLTVSRIMKSLLAACAALAIGASAASATIPSLLNFQGKLLDKSNNPRNGSFNFTFKIYDALTGGNLLWSETQNGISVTNGVFAVQLGAATPIPASVFASPATYLEITVGAEVGTPREALVTSPYAFKAAMVDSPLPAGDTQYIQVTQTLQAGATFYVSSGTVAGPLIIGGIITAGSGANAITTATGLLDASKLSGTVASAQMSGTYSNALTLNNSGNAFTGNGAGLTGVTAQHLLAGDTNYIQNRATLQSGATFYVAAGNVAGPFTATGTVTLGGAAGVNDVTVASNLNVSNNLTVSGAGPQVFGGNIQVNGNSIQDSAGTARITVGAKNLINGSLSTFAGNTWIGVSTNVAISGTSNNADHYLAFAFTAGSAITAKQVVVITGANAVGTTVTQGDLRTIGIAVNSASLGQTVYVAVSGVVSGVTVDGAVTGGDSVLASATAGQATDGPTACPGTPCNVGALGRALTGATGAGATITIAVAPFQF